MHHFLAVADFSWPEDSMDFPRDQQYGMRTGWTCYILSQVSVCHAPTFLIRVSKFMIYILIALATVLFRCLCAYLICLKMVSIDFQELFIIVLSKEAAFKTLLAKRKTLLRKDLGKQTQRVIRI